MKNNCMSKMQYLLYALLMFAMAGCGLSNLAGNQSGTPTNVSAKPVYSNVNAKMAASETVQYTKDDVASLQVTVIGTDSNGNSVPVVRNTFSTATLASNGGVFTVNNIMSPSAVTVSVKALGTVDATTNVAPVLYEGFAISVALPTQPNAQLNIQMSPPVEKDQDKQCIQCHETTLDVNGQGLDADFKQSGHYTGAAWTFNARTDNGVVTVGTGCAGCHGPQHNTPDPSTAGRCADCHSTVLPASHKGNAALIVPALNNCVTCHQPHNIMDFKAGKCIACHSVTQNSNASGTFVNDNNGVRAITTEFTKWSHHVTGVTLNDAHCSACHLEGTVVNGDVVVDTGVHMTDNKTHLRNADTDADFAWDPQNPNHSGMDNFCMSCHDNNGATSPVSVQIQAYINTNGLAAAGKTASPTNPFGDTISNRYDKMQRPAVVDASSQFNTTNNSHHAVKGPRYSGRTRVLGAARQIASPSTFANNSSQLLQGKRSTIFDAGNFNALYVPLGTDGTAATGLGDDSTLHCGDCHTVGQWKVGSSVNAAGQPTTAAIGAHGANNEYLLRNSIGTDQRHTQYAYATSAGVVTPVNANGAFLVCYNCHAFKKYGSVYNSTGPNGTHAGEYDTGGRCNSQGNTIPFNGYTTGKATDGTQFTTRFGGNVGIAATSPTGTPTVLQYTTAAPYAGETVSDFGNVLGIQCQNCHNSGLANGYGGIHGSAKNTGATDSTVTGGAYIDGMGNTTKVERFLPGLGNVAHVPGTLGGFTGGTVAGPVTNSGFVYTYTTGGISNDANWEQKHWNQTPTTVITYARDAQGNAVFGGTVSAGTTLARAGAGCYTLGGGTAAASVIAGPSVTGAGGAATAGLDNWGACEDHAGEQGMGNHGFVKQIVRPVTY